MIDKPVVRLLHIDDVEMEYTYLWCNGSQAYVFVFLLFFFFFPVFAHAIFDTT